MRPSIHNTKAGPRAGDPGTGTPDCAPSRGRAFVTPVSGWILSRARAFQIALLAASSAVLPQIVSAQSVGATVPVAEPARSMALTADSLYRLGEHEESFQRTEAYLGRHPDDYLAWVLSARDALVLGYATRDRDQAKAWLNRATEHADRGRALEPNGVDAMYLSLAAKGQRALLEGPRTRAQLGGQVAREAQALLTVDSLYASAHNALGRVYMEVAHTSWIERLGARVLMGGDVVGQATWENAERHLRRAAELQPERNFHLLDLGVLLVRRKRFEEAREMLERAIATPLEVPAQEGYREDARRWLEEIGR